MKYVIVIGHGAYSGKNSLHMCFSKAQAIRVLQARGVSRLSAISTVNTVCLKSYGYETIGASEVIEVRNAQYGIEQGHYSDLAGLRAYWKNQPEA